MLHIESINFSLICSFCAKTKQEVSICDFFSILAKAAIFGVNLRQISFAKARHRWLSDSTEYQSSCQIEPYVNSLYTGKSLLRIVLSSVCAFFHAASSCFVVQYCSIKRFNFSAAD